jgi:transcription antitermination factor NusG
MSIRPIVTLDEDESLLDAMKLPSEAAVPDGLRGRWWVAHTKPRTEKRLAWELRRGGLTYYLPLRRRQTRSRNTGRISRSIVPVFAGYLFLNCEEHERHRALATHRIVNLLPVASQDRLIGELRQLHGVMAAQIDFQVHDSLKHGDWARVIAGPLAGTEGVVVGRMSRARLVLNVGMLGQSVSVRVDADLLERIEEPDYNTHF